MRTFLLAVTVGLGTLAGCSSDPDKVGGAAGPAGRPPLPPSSAPAVVASSAPAASASAADGSDVGGATIASSAIRGTDWANVTIMRFGFLGIGDLTFRAGKATADHISCTMLPG